MNQRLIFYTVFVGCAMVGLARAEQTAVGSPAARLTHSRLEASSVEQLKRAYLECDRHATSRLLAMGDAAQCSTIHELLKARVFGGDFERMLAWWKAERVAAARLLGD
jgi:hypothetical protein